MLRPLGFTLLKLCRSANIICEQIRISRAGCCGRFSDRSTKVLRSISPPTYQPPHGYYIVHVEMRVHHALAVNRASTLFPFFFFRRSTPSRGRDRASKTVGGSFSFSPLKRGGEKNIGFIFKAKNFIYVYLLETWRISEENVV